MAASVYLGTMGVAALNWPHAMASLTWAGGVTTSVLAFCISYYTLYLMLEMHERDGRRCNRYRELGKLAFGRRCILACEAVPIAIKWGIQACAWSTGARGPSICGGFQYGALFAVVISYLVICGESMYAFYNIVCAGDCPGLQGLQQWDVFHCF